METTRRFNGLRRAAIALIAVAGCNGSATSTTTPTAPTPITRAFTEAEYNSRVEQIRTTAHSAPLVFVGTMTAVGASPGVWAGHLAARQPITYSNVRVLRGSHREASAVVDHPIVFGTLTADPASPQLSPTMFSVGKTVIVFAHYRRGRIIVADAQVGTIPHDADNEAAVADLLPPAR